MWSVVWMEKLLVHSATTESFCSMHNFGSHKKLKQMCVGLRCFKDTGTNSLVISVWMQFIEYIKQIMLQFYAHWKWRTEPKKKLRVFRTYSVHLQIHVCTTIKLHNSLVCHSGYKYWRKFENGIYLLFLFELVFVSTFNKITHLQLWKLIQKIIH